MRLSLRVQILSQSKAENRCILSCQEFLIEIYLSANEPETIIITEENSCPTSIKTQDDECKSVRLVDLTF
jgi:hypothetical protein